MQQIHEIETLELSTNKHVVCKELADVIVSCRVKKLVLRNYDITPEQLKEFHEALSGYEQVYYYVRLQKLLKSHSL